MAHPLLLTLAMDETGFAHFNALRKKHFPPERNFLDAHITLFHQLPPDRHVEIAAYLAQVAATTAPFAMRADGLMFLGQGVAFRLEAPQAQALRAHLAAHWHEWLIPQDQHKFQPHITVQNKTTPQAAKTLYHDMSAGFVPYELQAIGLDLWFYEGGPWRFAGRYAFGA